MEKLIEQLTQSLSAFEEAYSKFAEDEINVVPFEGSWTAGQLAQHIILSNAGFTEMLGAEVEETNRPADQFVEMLESILSDFDKKMDAPDFICPELKDYSKPEQEQSLVKIQKDIISIIPGLDLTKTCKLFPLPGLGYITRLEAIHFVIYHTQRHTVQLNNIHQKINQL